MTFHQISQRGKEYLKTGQTLLRAAQTMIDLAIADQLKALVNDFQRRADVSDQKEDVRVSLSNLPHWRLTG